VIVRPRPHWIHLLFVRRGSIVREIFTQQLFIFLLCCAVVLLHGQLFHWKVTLNSSPFSLMGVALAIFLGFRINVSYERYWEARKLWGTLLIEARNLARQALTLPVAGTEARPFVLGTAAFAHVLRNQLRGEPRDKSTAELLPGELQARVATARFAPALVLLWLGERLGEWRHRGQLDPFLSQSMEQALSRLSSALGGCERIASTPLPFTYTVILHRSAYLYCMLLPFGLVDSIGLMTPLVVTFVSYTFFALEALSDQLEDPFGRQPNDLPLDALAAGVEASLREMLGETPAPAPQPDADFVLS